MKKYCFIFVCQSGELEIKSLLLAASLKYYLHGHYELVAAIPQPANYWGDLADSTLNLMPILGIRTVPIYNRIDANYPIGNKVACLNIETEAEQLIFLDSDILCLQQWSPSSIFEAPFKAKPADLVTFPNEISMWQKIYDLFQMPLPQRRMISTTSGQLMLPYFNAGVIAVQNGLNFGKVWENCCQKIDAEPSITHKRPWLDQIALPISVQQLNLNYECLDERFNYPAHLKPLPAALPVLCHYHWPAVIRREPILNQLVKKLTQIYPLLKTMLLATPEWATLLKPHILHPPSRQFFPSWSFAKPKKTQHPEIIITGMPRSGTSYLCRLLHSISNCVIINEPTQIFQPLTSDLIPWSIATFYQELRRDILDGQPIENKIHQGQLIDDTAVIDTRTAYHPQVSRPDFLLGTKNTLTYMARLTHLRQVLPQVQMIACVRHPLDTIASWKTSFPHLNQAAVTEFPVGHVNDPLLMVWQRQALAEIANTSQMALKRALLWRYLAECLLMNAHQLIIVPYEQLVGEPIKVLKQLLQKIPNAPPFHPTEKIVASTIRQKREVLDEEDLQAINDVCSEPMVALGYSRA